MPDRYPLVSIICPCKNRRMSIRRCIDSVLNQDYPNIEFLIQDGASTDGTLEIIREYNDDRIKLVSRPDKGSAEATFELIRKRINGDYFWACLSDEELLPHAVSWGVRELTDNPELAAIYGDVHITDIDGNYLSTYIAPDWNLKEFICREIVPPFSSSIFRVACLEKINFRTIDWIIDCGEADIWTRLGLLFPIKHVSNIVSKYTWDKSQSSKSKSQWLDVIIPATIKHYDRLFGDPGTPSDILELKDRAYAGLYLWSVQELLASGATNEAIFSFSEAFKYQPDGARLAYISTLLFEHGKELLRRGSVDDAFACFKCLIRHAIIEPNHLQSLVFNGSDSAPTDGEGVSGKATDFSIICSDNTLIRPEDCEQIYLSIIVTTRNDDHGGDMLPRMQAFVNSLARQCRIFNVAIELIVIEWNPPQDRKRIYEALNWPRTLEPLMVRFIEVPPRIHDSLDNSDKFPLFQMIAKNIGIRRARGKFVLATNIDILFSDELIWFISQRILNDNVFYRVDRYDVSRIDVDSIKIDLLLEYCRKHIIRVHTVDGTAQLYFHLIPEIEKNIFNLGKTDLVAFHKSAAALHTNACGDFTLMSKSRWHEFRAYPEIQKWSIFLDGLAVHMAHASGLQQIILSEPLRIYHIEHDFGWALVKDTTKNRPSIDYEQYQLWCETMLHKKHFISPNDADWGYANSNFAERVIK